MSQCVSRCSCCGRVATFGELSSLPEVIEHALYLAGIRSDFASKPDDDMLMHKYGYTQEDSFCTICYGVVTSV